MDVGLAGLAGCALFELLSQMAGIVRGLAWTIVRQPAGIFAQAVFEKFLQRLSSGTANIFSANTNVVAQLDAEGAR
jgi:hypothetical protein